MGKRLFATIASLGLLIGLIAGVVGAGTAAAETPPGSQSDLIFFPWVPNGETLNNSNPWYGSIVVQNIESVPINLQLGPTAGGVFPISAIVQPHASYTFSAADLATKLGWSGNGGGVVAAATWVTSQLPSDICQSETGSLVFQRDDDAANLPAGMTKTADQDVLAALPLGAKVTELTWSGGSTTDFTQSGNEITWGATRPADKTNVTAVYTYALCTRGPQIGGVEKQAAPTNSGFMVSTDSSMSSVDGYTAIPDTDVAWGASSQFCQKANPSGVCNNLGSYSLGFPVGGFDGTSYLPIVQGNYSGWDTYIHVTNIDASTPNGGGQITITYYAQGQGVGNTGSFVDQLNLKAGQSTTIDVGNKAPAGFVGSAWITSQYGIVVSASRVKNTMALTNTNVPSLFATTSPDNGTRNNGDLGVAASCTAIDGTMCQMYAPLVYLDYNGWNTGFNIVNTSEFLNQVTINVVNRDGTSVGVFTAAIPAKGMQYVYIPASQDQGLGQGDFTAAILTASAPFNATIDEVKYNTGEAMSYNATATMAIASGQGFDSRFFGNSLSLPLYQAGTVSNGVSHGDTSGINLFNPTGNQVKGVVNFYMSTGAAAGSTQIGGGTPFTLGAMGSALVAYAPSQANITPGSQLSAVVTVTGGQGGVVGVSNEVNYDVNGDGGVVFNMLNLDGQYRYPCSQTSCGSPVPPVAKFASKLTLGPAEQWVPHDPIMATVTATAYDANGHPQAGVPVTFTVSGPISSTATPNKAKIKTDASGQAIFKYYNTQVGTDTVTATAPAPNGQKLSAVPPSVLVHWTQPTLAVSPTPQTVYLSDNGGSPSPSYTWSWDFTVTGFSDCSQIPAINWSVDSNTNINKPQRFGPTTGYTGLTWTKSGNDNCTATNVSYTSPNPDALAGKTKTYTWSLATDTPTPGDNTTQLTWVAPTLSVQVCTINGTTCTSDNPTANPPNTTTTVTANAQNQGSWKYTFTVKGIPADDVANGWLQYAPTTSLSYNPGGHFATSNLDGAAWNCDSTSTAPTSLVTCTATQTNTNIDISSRIGTTETLNWYLDLNQNGTQDGVEPSGNQTTVHYVAAPTFQALVEVQNPSDGTTNPGGFVSTINANDFVGVIDNGQFNQIYQFTYTNPAITDCSSLNSGTTPVVTATNVSPPDSFGTGATVTGLTWTGTAPTCTATVTYNSQFSNFAGKVRELTWQIQDGATTVTDGTTTINYPDYDASTVDLAVKAGSGNGTDWATTFTIPYSTTSPHYTWQYQLTVSGYPNCSLVPTTVTWASQTGTSSAVSGTGTYTGLTWTKSGSSCVAIAPTPPNTSDAALAGDTGTYVFSFAATNPSQTVSSNQVTVNWGAAVPVP